MNRYKLYNPNKGEDFPKMFRSIDDARASAMKILAKDWSIGYIPIKRIHQDSIFDTVPGMVVRNVSDYYTPQRILRFYWIVGTDKGKRTVTDIKSDGSLVARRN